MNARATLQISFQDDTDGRGWVAWDSSEAAANPADSIPGTTHLAENDFEAARAAATRAWGQHWAAAEKGEWVSA